MQGWIKILVVVLLFSGCLGGNGSISGKVIPANSGIKVRAIQNLAVIGETTVDPSDGSYVITNLPEGKYALLIIDWGDRGYVYNDEINYHWHSGINETITVIAGKDSPNHDYYLGTEPADYIADEIILIFNYSIPVEKRIEIISSNNCSIKERTEWDDPEVTDTYLIDIPDDKTVFEMLGIFRSNPDVNDAQHNFIIYSTQNGG